MAQFTTAEVADKFNTDARTLRKFLRDDARATDAPIAGKGARWTLEGKNLRSLRSRFTAWSKSQEEARAARAAKVEEEVTDEVPAEEVEATA